MVHRVFVILCPVVQKCIKLTIRLTEGSFEGIESYKETYGNPNVDLGSIDAEPLVGS